jgi:DnaK suppressor protein
MDANQTRELLRTLEQELHSLATRLRAQATSAPDAGGVGLTEGDRGTDLFDQVQATESLESHFATRDRIVERLQRVAAALDRAKDGSYGECVECAEPIPVARLRALPEATTCVACQERLERTGQWAARQAAPSMLGEIETPTARGGRPVDVGDLRRSSEILETLRESVVPEMPAASAAPARGDRRRRELGHPAAARGRRRPTATAPRAGRGAPEYAGGRA